MASLSSCGLSSSGSSQPSLFGDGIPLLCWVYGQSSPLLKNQDPQTIAPVTTEKARQLVFLAHGIPVLVSREAQLSNNNHGQYVPNDTSVQMVSIQTLCFVFVIKEYIEMPGILELSVRVLIICFKSLEIVSCFKFLTHLAHDCYGTSKTRGSQLHNQSVSH